MTHDLSKLKSIDTLPWIEKYRPATLDDVVSHDTIIHTLKEFVKNKCLPHLLFYGPPGSGKTSVIMACARELYGDNYEMMVLDINASEERGIEVVRNRITQFVKSKNVFGDENGTMFKLVILDEADAMTLDAQAILRRVIETYTTNARFCLICNYVKKINIALQSRCTPFRFSPLSTKFMKEKMDEIIIKEKVTITDDGIDTIVKRSGGDMRKVLNILQSANMAYKNIDGQIINNCLGYPSKTNMTKILSCLFKNNFEKCYIIIQLIKKDNGYSLQDIITELNMMLTDYILTEDKKKYDYLANTSVKKITYILDKMRTIEFNLTNCINDNIQISALIGLFHFYPTTT
jgi:replication factor C subunit 3/5